MWWRKSVKTRKRSQILWGWLSEKTVYRYFCSISDFRSPMVSRRIKKNLFPNAFYLLNIFSFNSRPKFSLFLNIIFLKFQKLIFFAKFSKKRSFLPAKAVDKTENAKNNKIKTSILPPDSLKSVQNYFLRQSPTKMFETLWNSAKYHVSCACFKALYFCRKFERRENSNLVKEPGH